MSPKFVCLLYHEQPHELCFRPPLFAKLSSLVFAKSTSLTDWRSGTSTNSIHAVWMPRTNGGSKLLASIPNHWRGRKSCSYPRTSFSFCSCAASVSSWRSAAFLRGFGFVNTVIRFSFETAGAHQLRLLPRWLIPRQTVLNRVCATLTWRTVDFHLYVHPLICTIPSACRKFPLICTDI